MLSTDLGYVEYRSAPDIFGEDRWIVGKIRSAEVRDGVRWYHVEPLVPLPTEGLPHWVTDQHVREWERPASTWRSNWQPVFA